jgi:hypothetical protein
LAKISLTSELPPSSFEEVFYTSAALRGTLSKMSQYWRPFGAMYDANFRLGSNFTKFERAGVDSTRDMKAWSLFRNRWEREVSKGIVGD